MFDIEPRLSCVNKESAFNSN